MTKVANDRPVQLVLPEQPKDSILDVNESHFTPPDDGFRAWIQCAGGFCIFFNTWGMLNSFGNGLRIVKSTH